MTRFGRLKSSKRSAWSRTPASLVEGTPSVETTEKPGEPGLVARAARVAATDVNAALRGGRALADRVGVGVRRGLGQVEHALEDPVALAASELVKQADLPELDGHDALGSLAVRLDREADLWRGIAMRQHTRLAWSERLAITGTFVALLGGTLLAAIAGFRALFAAEAGASVSLLVGTASLALVGGALTVGRVAARARQTQLEVARDALLRADLAEVRIHRVAALLELRGIDEQAYRIALRSFEVDVRSA